MMHLLLLQLLLFLVNKSIAKEEMDIDFYLFMRTSLYTTYTTTTNSSRISKKEKEEEENLSF